MVRDARTMCTSLFRSLEGHELAEILHAWKSFSATRANRALRRSGGFWQREYYDHLVRSEDEFYRIVSYIAEKSESSGDCALALGGRLI